MNIHNHDAPCVLCYVGSRGSHMVIPATNEHSAGWTREYHGLHFRHKHSSEFVINLCALTWIQKLRLSGSGSDGALLYVVEGSCGGGGGGGGLALPCKPYIDGYELTCVVCTKYRTK